MTPDKQKKFDKAIKGAADKLKKKKKCLDLIGSGAISTLQSSTWDEDFIGESNNVAAAADPSANSVHVNVLGGFFVPIQTFTASDGTAFQVDLLDELRRFDSSDDNLRVFIILHELAHLTKKLGPDRNDKGLSDRFNQDIYDNCFK